MASRFSALFRCVGVFCLACTLIFASVPPALAVCQIPCPPRTSCNRVTQTCVPYQGLRFWLPDNLNNLLEALKKRVGPSS